MKIYEIYYWVCFIAALYMAATKNIEFELMFLYLCFITFRKKSDDENKTEVNQDFQIKVSDGDIEDDSN
jgi:hypothetical protein